MSCKIRRRGRYAPRPTGDPPALRASGLWGSRSALAPRIGRWRSGEAARGIEREGLGVASAAAPRQAEAERRR